MKNKGLWTKNYTLLTLTTILSCISGEAMSLVVSFLVYDETKSTFLSALILAFSIFPDIIIPIFIAPLIDRISKKKIVIYLDLLMAIMYFFMGIFILNNEFKYSAYLFFTLATSSISVIYYMSFNSWFPDLIPKGFEQKGYAVSSAIYPTVSIFISPLGAILYKNIGVGVIFICVAILGLIDVLLESKIDNEGTTKLSSEKEYSFKKYKNDLKEGFKFFKNEKGLRNIYTYMSVSNGTGFSTYVLTQAFFQRSSILTLTMFGFLNSSETLGRLFGSLKLYKKEIPVKKRYSFTKTVYALYNIIDSIILFLPYPLMIISRFFCGLLGNQSGTIRYTAVNAYLPQEIRARIDSFINVMFAVGGFSFQLIGGALGEIIPYKYATLLMGSLSFLVMVIFIYIPKKDNLVIYEAVAQKEL